MREQLIRWTCFKWNSHFVIEHFWFLLTCTVKITQLFIICTSIFPSSFNGFSSGSCKILLEVTWDPLQSWSQWFQPYQNLIKLEKLTATLGLLVLKEDVVHLSNTGTVNLKTEMGQLASQVPIWILKSDWLLKHESPASLDSFRSIWEFSILP